MNQASTATSFAFSTAALNTSYLIHARCDSSVSVEQAMSYSAKKESNKEFRSSMLQFAVGFVITPRHKKSSTAEAENWWFPYSRQWAAAQGKQKREHSALKVCRVGNELQHKAYRLSSHARLEAFVIQTKLQHKGCKKGSARNCLQSSQCAIRHKESKRAPECTLCANKKAFHAFLLLVGYSILHSHSCSRYNLFNFTIYSSSSYNLFNFSLTKLL